MFEKVKNYFSGSPAVNTGVGATKEKIKAESEKTKAMGIIDSDKRLKKIYENEKGKMDKTGVDMQEKFLKAVMKYGENVGGYNKDAENWEKAVYSSVPEMSGGGSKLIEKDARVEVAYAEKMKAAKQFFETGAMTNTTYGKNFDTMSDQKKESYLKAFVEDPKSANKRFSWDDKKKEYVYKESYTVEL